MKDLFSGHAQDYAQFRPKYPKSLFQFLAETCKQRELVWDCATGNGQAAVDLAAHFKKVVATDMSEQQLQSATAQTNVEYRKATAEHSGLPDHNCDLVTVAQALHWFDFEKFFAEVTRVSKPHGIFAAWSYDLCEISPQIDSLVNDLYHNFLAGYWEYNRTHVDNRYAEIPFPFSSLPTPEFAMQEPWSIDQLIGYLGTWSGLKTAIKKGKENPLPALKDKILPHWKSEKMMVKWPLTVKLFRVRRT